MVLTAGILRATYLQGTVRPEDEPEAMDFVLRDVARGDAESLG
jgi:hypothetical protein